MKEDNFLTNPSKITLIIFTVVQFIAVSLLILASFNEDGSFDKPNILNLFFVFAGTWAVAKLYINYFRNRNIKNKNAINITKF